MRTKTGISGGAEVCKGQGGRRTGAPWPSRPSLSTQWETLPGCKRSPKALVGACFRRANTQGGLKEKGTTGERAAGREDTMEWSVGGKTRPVHGGEVTAGEAGSRHTTEAPGTALSEWKHVMRQK